MSNTPAIVTLGVGAVFYFIPSIVAGSRHTLNAGGVFVVNLLFGWTFIGWVIALAMAAGGVKRGELGIGPTGPAPPQVSPSAPGWGNGREGGPARRDAPPR